MLKRRGAGIVYQRGEKWWIKFYRNGKPCYESSRSLVRADAVSGGPTAKEPEPCQECGRLEWGILSIVGGQETDRIIEQSSEEIARDWVTRFPKSYKLVNRLAAGPWRRVGWASYTLSTSAAAKPQAGEEHDDR